MFDPSAMAAILALSLESQAQNMEAQVAIAAEIKPLHVQPPPPPKPRKVKPRYPNNLDGWIREARAVMKKHGIPGSYAGIKRNILRESSGNPKAVNNWDINAKNGVPSKGLLQVIKPTFDAFHVPGTKHDQFDPVANIVAACNYAWKTYGSIDAVNGAY